MSSRSKHGPEGARNTLQDNQIQSGRDFRVGDNINDNSRSNYYQFIFGAGKISLSLLSFTLAGTLFLGIYFFRSQMLIPPGGTPAREVAADPEHTAGSDPEMVAVGDSAEQQTDHRRKVPLNTNPSPRTPNEPKPKDDSSDLIDTQQQINVAFFQPSGLEFQRVREKLFEKIRTGKLKISATFFRPQFMRRFSAPLPTLDFAYLRSLNLPLSLHCICQISEDIVFQENTYEGEAFWTAKGKFRLQIYDLTDDDLITVPFKNLQGAGVTRDAALASLEDRILQSGDWNKLDFSSCK